MECLLAFPIGYAFGCFLTADVVCRMSVHKSCFSIGDGNPGMANVGHVLGTKAALAVLAGDILKTLLAILISCALGRLRRHGRAQLPDLASFPGRQGRHDDLLHDHPRLASCRHSLLYRRLCRRRRRSGLSLPRRAPDSLDLLRLDCDRRCRRLGTRAGSAPRPSHVQGASSRSSPHQGWLDAPCIDSRQDARAPAPQEVLGPDRKRNQGLCCIVEDKAPGSPHLRMPLAERVQHKQRV